MKWFGPAWDAPVCEDVTEAATPVWELCAGCDKPILEGDRGFILPFATEPARVLYYHRYCFLREILPRE